uniref:Uncharacterized protein n=1 Tax=Micrurus paraensis TaxID=1970185 RepID=A0A2D4JVC5_9SAUR
MWYHLLQCLLEHESSSTVIKHWATFFSISALCLHTHTDTHVWNIFFNFYTLILPKNNLAKKRHDHNGVLAPVWHPGTLDLYSSLYYLFLKGRTKLFEGYCHIVGFFLVLLSFNINFANKCPLYFS